MAAPAPEEDVPALPPHPVVRRRTAIGLVAAAFLIGVVLSGAVTGAVLGQSDDAAAPLPSTSARSAEPAADAATAPAIVVENGTDPAETPCVDDAAVVASEMRSHDTQLQIIYSASCHAAWARITRYDNHSAGNAVSTSIYRQIAPDAADKQSTTEPDAESAYTTLLVRPTPATRLCAVGSITRDGERLDLGTPLCL